MHPLGYNPLTSIDPLSIISIRYFMIDGVQKVKEAPLKGFKIIGLRNQMPPLDTS
jgi:hypothetical protein